MVVFVPELEPIVEWVMSEFAAVETCMLLHFAFAALDESHSSLVVAVAVAEAVAATIKLEHNISLI